MVNPLQPAAMPILPAIAVDYIVISPTEEYDFGSGIYVQNASEEVVHARKFQDPHMGWVLEVTGIEKL